jgi:hypothetical protein
MRGWFDEFIGMVILGLITLFCTLAPVSFIVVVAYHSKIALEVLGVLIILYALGKATDEFFKYTEKRRYEAKYGKTPVPSESWGIPAVDGLLRLEKKYNFKTVEFMALVKQGKVPPLINNLDHLEWVALVNELALLREDEK